MVVGVRRIAALGLRSPVGDRGDERTGADLSNARNKSVNEFVDQSFDLVVTVCDHAKEACPAFPGAAMSLHWPFDDPADATGTDEEKMVVFRRVRDEIREKIRGYLER